MRVHNFGAGPCTLPLSVLEEAQAELLDFHSSGMSILEMSHRSKAYEEVHRRALDLTRQVSGAPAGFEVLFIQGGATLQFGMVPMNLLGPGERAGYVVSGSWGKRAISDGAEVADVYAAWDGASSGYTRMPSPAEIQIAEGTRFLHVTTNETIGGIRMVEWPETTVPLVADMSSEYLTRPIEWERYDLVYGGVQKNLAPAGLAVVFVRSAVIELVERSLPSYLQYRWHAAADSLANTPPMLPIYIMGKVLERIEEGGGIPTLEKASAAKAGAVYAAIDESMGFYSNPVERQCRSHMNVVFRLPTPELEKEFITEAEARGMIGLKGHRSVGGCRASLYAALEMASVEALVTFMGEFRKAH